MPKVSPEHRAAMRGRIHSAALACFMKHGVTSTTMAQIVDESGLSAGAIYGYYPSKTELTRAVAETVLSDRREQILEVAGRDPLPAPVELISTLIRTLPKDVVDSAVTLQFWGNAHQDPMLHDLASGVIQSLRNDTVSYLTRWLVRSGWSQEEAHGRASAVFPAVLALLQGYLVQAALTPAMSAQDYVMSTQYLMDGLLARPGMGRRDPTPNDPAGPTSDH